MTLALSGVLVAYVAQQEAGITPVTGNDHMLWSVGKSTGGRRP